MALRFVPPKNVARYAYAVEYERSQTKFDTYNELGSAKNALRHKLRYRSSDFKAAYILENVDGDWYVLYTVTKDTEEMPWYKEVTYGWRRNWSSGKAARPMTRDEYAEWRLAVERERTSF